jgi:hypothetical protein
MNSNLTYSTFPVVQNFLIYLQHPFSSTLAPGYHGYVSPVSPPTPISVPKYFLQPLSSLILRFHLKRGGSALLNSYAQAAEILLCKTRMVPRHGEVFGWVLGKDGSFLILTEIILFHVRNYL